MGIRLTIKGADLLTKAALRHLSQMHSKVKTIIFDNSFECDEQATTAKGLSADSYLAHPYASWQQSINENAKGLTRLIT